jgi:ribonuclease Z
MKKSGKKKSEGLTRRDMLKLSGLGLGGLVLGINGKVNTAAAAGGGGGANKDSYFSSLKPYVPGKKPLGADEMRITFLGSWFSPRISQSCNSVFVEVGWDSNKNLPRDQFIFDCGSGVVAKYFAMGIPLSRMDKIFLTHLHGDHMSDLTHIYCFGPAYDRKKPLYVWGPQRSGLIYRDPNDNVSGPYNDGTADYCSLLREAARWHTESFSFQSTALTNYNLPLWTCPDATPGAPPSDKKDAYDLVPFELDWRKTGFDANGNPASDNVAYYNADTGVKITHFPAVHNRQGSISYKLEWNGLSMIFTGDTKPNYYVVSQATNGVDVLIHEMTPPPDVWTEKFTGLYPGDPGYDKVLADTTNVQDSSHTEQKMYGYILSLLAVPPRLAVGTHFPATDDTIRAALKDIRSYYPKSKGDVAVATDFVVLTVSKKSISQRRAVVSDFVWAPPSDPSLFGASYDTPKYWTYSTDQNGNQTMVGNPYAQLDPNAKVIPTPPDYDQR